MRALLALLLFVAPAFAQVAMPPVFDPGPKARPDVVDVIAWGLPNPAGPSAVGIRVGADTMILLPDSYVAAIVAAQHHDYLVAQAKRAARTARITSEPALAFLRK